MRPAVLLAAWAVCACLQAVNGLVRISELYMPAGQQLALLPGAAMVGVVESALPGVATPEGCAEMCREALPACTFFAFCNAQSVSAIVDACGRLPRGCGCACRSRCPRPRYRLGAAPRLAPETSVHPPVPCRAVAAHNPMGSWSGASACS